jgi:fatty-acyl-CoA synthase
VTPDLPGVAGAFQAQAERRPAATFLRFRDDRWTWADASAQAHALACALQNLGLEKGDRIGINLPNWPEFVLSVLAAAELGATVVPLSPSLAPRDLQFVLRTTECAAVVTAERYGSVDYLELFEGMLSDLPDLQYLVTVGEEDLWYDDRVFQFEDLVSAGRGRVLSPVEVADDDPAAILYTAGTSQKQKGVVLSHANLLWTAERTARALRLDPDEATLCVVPLSNIFGLGTAFLTSVMAGAGLGLVERFTAAETLDRVEQWRPTVLHGVPTVFVLLRRELVGRAADLSSLRTGIIAGAPVPPELARAVREEIVPDVEIAYGLTETSPTVTITSPTDGEARSETTGRPLDGVEIRILGDGGPAPAGATGEIAVRGPNVMLGYFRQPAATRAAVTADGYLRTGDLGTIDPSGHLRVVGRLSDVILRGGYGVHPREVEDQLRSLPAVQEAAVVGVPNEVLGEIVCACVVPVEGALVTEEEVRDLCRPALAEFKLPDVVMFFDELPEAENGRARRAELVRIMKLRLAEGSRPPD